MRGTPDSTINDQISVEAVAYDVDRGYGYKLQYYVAAPIDVFWRFKTDFAGDFVLRNDELLEHRLVRTEGNDEALKETAMRNAHTLAAGHCFVLVLKNAFPINVSNAIKQCPEVCSLYCATANPVEVIVAETEQGRGILGVIDGFKPKGVE